MKVVLLSLLTLVLAGCGTARTFGDFGLTIENIDSNEVVRTVRYLDGDEAGPDYEVSFMVPDTWVGNFETRMDGNSIAFDFIFEDNRRASIFFIDALSEAQYWAQIGSYPGLYENLYSDNNTFFVYHLPDDSYYSGLSADEYERLRAEASNVAVSLEAVRVD